MATQVATLTGSRTESPTRRWRPFGPDCEVRPSPPRTRVMPGSEPSSTRCTTASRRWWPAARARPTWWTRSTSRASNGLIVAVRGGGHSVAGLSSIDGGMLVDLAPMRGVQVDPDRRLAHVQGGALWGDVTGDPGVRPGRARRRGVRHRRGGAHARRRYGWLRRKYGLSCDNLVEAEVVSADGRC